MYKELILLLSLTAAALGACEGNHEINGLTSGLVTFSGSSGLIAAGQSNFAQTFATSFSQKPRIALGIWDQNFSTASADSFGQFSIQVSDVTVSKVSFAFKYKPGVWTSIKIGFWATSRSDIVIGTSFAQFISLKGSTSAINVQTPTISNANSSIVRAFLNGFGVKTGSTGIQIQIEGRSVQPNGISIALTTGPNTDLSKAWYSYVVFSPSTLPFASYGGSVQQNSFTGTGAKDIQNLIQTPNNLLQGLTKLNSGFSVNLSTNIDSDFVYSYTSGVSVDFSYSYVAVGNPPSRVCSQCPGSMSLDSQCVSSCPSGFYVYQYNGGGSACHRCSSKLNEVLNAQGTGCSCISGYGRVNGSCTSLTNKNLTSSYSAESPQSGSQYGSQAGSQYGSQAGSQSSYQSSSQSSYQAGSQSGYQSGSQSGSQSTFQPTFQPAISNNNYNPNPAAIPINNNNNPNPLIPSTLPVPNISNSYIPTQPSNPNPIPATPITPIVITPTTPSVVTPNLPITSASGATSAESCANFPNTYWTGYRCACRVGYRFEPTNGQCLRITFDLPSNTVCNQNEIFNGTCVCIVGFYRNLTSGFCVPNPTCPPNSKPSGYSCICDQGYVKVGENCVVSQACPPYSHPESGVCVCDTGYQKNSQGVCVPVSVCPANHQKNPSTNICECIPGYYLVSPSVCDKCQNGGYWNGTACIFLCGSNQQFNSATKVCECKPGYGRMNGPCIACEGEYFALGGYCVVCPLNSVHNVQTNKCDCLSGFSQTAVGQCISECGANQVYDVASKKCKCIAGLYFVSPNQCGLCPSGTVPNDNTQTCNSCQPSQILQNGICACQPGQGIISNGGCAVCESQGLHLLNGYCVSCPTDKVWSGSGCVCASGQSEVGGRCTAACKPNELLDEAGNCYSCPVNEVVENGYCRCKNGFSRNPVTQFCEQVCSPGTYIINGVCGTCVGGTVYDQNIKACVCQPGSFTNTFDNCQVRPIVCIDGQYLDPTLGCVPCPYGCKTCESATKCLTCIDSTITPNGAICTSNVCGNGVRTSGEQCDDGNTRNGDGCSDKCLIQNNFNCVGDRPSVCTVIPQRNCGNGLPDIGQSCDDGNIYSGDGCSSSCFPESGYTCTVATLSRPSTCTKNSQGITLVGDVYINSGAVSNTIITNPAFVFASESEMSNFIKYKFEPGTEPTAAYCTQRPNEIAKFDCLYLYPAGVPLKPYTIELSFNKDGSSGNLKFTVDYRTGQLALRSLH